jgi:hypothetical protein
MFTDLFLITTNPKLKLSELFGAKLIVQILFSAIFHTVVYALFVNLVTYIFFGKMLSNAINFRLAGSLFIIMAFGFLARFFHVKNIYKAYNYDLEKTRNHLDKLYIGWVFIS